MDDFIQGTLLMSAFSLDALPSAGSFIPVSVKIRLLSCHCVFYMGRVFLNWINPKQVLHRTKNVQGADLMTCLMGADTSQVRRTK